MTFAGLQVVRRCAGRVVGQCHQATSTHGRRHGPCGGMHAMAHVAGVMQACRPTPQRALKNPSAARFQAFSGQRGDARTLTASGARLRTHGTALTEDSLIQEHKEKKPSNDAASGPVSPAKNHPRKGNHERATRP